MIWIVVYLTHLDYQDTERIMTEKLQNQVNGTEWSWKNLNTVSCCFYFTVFTWVPKARSKRRSTHVPNQTQYSSTLE